MTCSQCGDRFEAGFLRHAPTCSFYRMNPARVLFDHPCLVELEGYLSYWYPMQLSDHGTAASAGS